MWPKLGLLLASKVPHVGRFAIRVHSVEKACLVETVSVLADIGEFRAF